MLWTSKTKVMNWAKPSTHESGSIQSPFTRTVSIPVSISVTVKFRLIGTMGSKLNLSAKQSINIDTMINFDSDGHGHGTEAAHLNGPLRSHQRFRSVWCPRTQVIFTARKRSLRRLCFYTCLSVHRGCVWQGACLVGGMCGGGMCGDGQAW